MVSPHVEAKVESESGPGSGPQVVAVEKDDPTAPPMPRQPPSGYQQYQGMPQYQCPPPQAMVGQPQYVEGEHGFKPVPFRGMPAGVVAAPAGEGVMPMQHRQMEMPGAGQGPVPHMSYHRPQPHPPQRGFHGHNPNMSFPPVQPLAPLTQVRPYKLA